MGTHVPGRRQRCHATEQFDYPRQKSTYSPTESRVLEYAENYGKPPSSGKNNLNGSAVLPNTQNWADRRNSMYIWQIHRKDSLMSMFNDIEW